MGLRLELMERRFEEKVLKTITLKIGGVVKLAAIPPESMQPLADSEERRFAAEPGLRKTNTGHLVVDGLIRVTQDPKDKVPVVELVKVTKTRSSLQPKPISPTQLSIASGGEVEEVVGRYRDDGSFGKRRVFITATVGDVKTPREIPSLIVSDTPGSLYGKEKIDWPRYVPASHRVSTRP